MYEYTHQNIPKKKIIKDCTKLLWRNHSKNVILLRRRSFPFILIKKKLYQPDFSFFYH